MHEQKTWSYGEDYLVLKECTYAEILRDMAEGVEFLLNWKVREAVLLFCFAACDGLCLSNR